ncbi:MAG TPA: hypothetical protein VM101_10110 [Flavitalea sp.]|nr:hypothetical protein [Flavitalea sp.]
MRKIVIVAAACFLLAITSRAQLISYGSNHGKYVSIRNTPIYYEEYGHGVPLLLQKNLSRYAPREPAQQ